MAHNIKKIKTGEFGIKVPFSRTCRIQDISQNHNLCLHQRKITLPGLLWDTLYIEKKWKVKWHNCLGWSVRSNFGIWRKLANFWKPVPYLITTFKAYATGVREPKKQCEIMVSSIFPKTKQKTLSWVPPKGKMLRIVIFSLFFGRIVDTINCLTASIFESGPMPTPWKFLDSLPVIPSC